MKIIIIFSPKAQKAIEKRQPRINDLKEAVISASVPTPEEVEIRDSPIEKKHFGDITIVIVVDHMEEDSVINSKRNQYLESISKLKKSGRSWLCGLTPSVQFMLDKNQAK